MRVFTPQECAEIVHAFDQVENKLDENAEAYYRNSRGIGNLPITLTHVDRITKRIQEQYPGAVFSNTYTREYRKGSVLALHTDRPGLDLTLSICLEKSIPRAWPLNVSKVTYGKDVWETDTDPTPYRASYDSYDMPEGVGAMCEGRKYPHWRDALECADDERVVCVFYHWTLPAKTVVTPTHTPAMQFRPSMVIQCPDVKVYDNFLSESECALLVWLARERLARSTVMDNSNGGSYVDQNRTSHGMHFTVGENPLIAHIEAKINALTGIPIENGEGLQVLRYQIGQEYKPHFDYFDPNSPGVAKQVENNRICTVLLYLNTPTVGGETVFPDAGVSVSARRGTALVFSYPHPSPDTKTLHGGAPVIQGEKWVATKWLRKNTY